MRGSVVFKKCVQVVAGLWLLTAPLLGQGKRLWVLRAPGEMVEYDPATFAVKQTVKVLAEAVENPLGLSVNHQGQILFVPIVNLFSRVGRSGSGTDMRPPRWSKASREKWRPRDRTRRSTRQLRRRGFRRTEHICSGLEIRRTGYRETDWTFRRRRPGKHGEPI